MSASGLMQSIEESNRIRDEQMAVRANLIAQLNAEVLNHGFRGLVWINAVGAGALLTWLQAARDEYTIRPLPKWLIFGTASLLVGVLAGSLIFVPRFFANGSRRLWWRRAQWSLCAISVLAFVLGMGLAMVGALKSLPG